MVMGAPRRRALLVLALVAFLALGAPRVARAQEEDSR